jgi:hypothetical protein
MASYYLFVIELTDGTKVEAKGFSKIHDGVLTIESPYSSNRDAKQHFPLTQIRTWTSEPV